MWIALAVTAPGFGDALAGADRSVQLVAAIGLWVTWAVGLLASLVPTTVSLTVLRLLVPAAPVASVIAVVAGAGGVGVAAVALATAAAALVLTGEVGETFVQGSAYGAERRLLLRPPGPLVPALGLFWALLAAATIAGPLLLADGAVVVGVLLCVLAVGLGVVLGPRFHRLSNRWLVVVPAGLVVHDSLVLADTFMVPSGSVRSVGLAEVDTEAADLTGNALGPAVEIELADFETVVLAADRSNPGGRALHVRAVLVSPTRPGRAIAAWSGR